MIAGWKNNPQWRVYNDMRLARKLETLHRRQQTALEQAQVDALNAAADEILAAAEEKIRKLNPTRH